MEVGLTAGRMTVRPRGWPLASTSAAGVLVVGLSVTAAGIARWTAIPLVLLAAVLLRGRDATLALVAYGAVLASGVTWPLAAYTAFVVWALAHGWPEVRRLATRPTSRATWAGLALGVVAGAATLLLFGHQLRWNPVVVPIRWPGMAGIVLLAVAGAVFNALGEELLWRILVPSLMGTSRSVAFAVVVPGLSFGIAHYFGLPSGWGGVAAACTYGIALSALHRRHGFAACVLAHVVTDVMLFWWALRWAFFAS